MSKLLNDLGCYLAGAICAVLIAWLLVTWWSS